VFGRFYLERTIGTDDPAVVARQTWGNCVRDEPDPKKEPCSVVRIRHDAQKIKPDHGLAGSDLCPAPAAYQSVDLC
jgi:hypothetical protein